MKKKISILVVDDDSAHRIMLKTLLETWGYAVFEADDGSTAFEKVKQKAFDLILMDIKMLKVSGIEALDMIKNFNPSIPVIIMTAYSSVETAVKALKKGAYDYITKPLDFDKLKITIKKAAEHAYLKTENQALKKRIAESFDHQNIIGKSEAMIKLMEAAAQIAYSEADVLITGESGTGKELIGNVIHYNGSRKNNPFIKINCAAIPETLLEAELFGYVKGSFTGAIKDKKGVFLLANRGAIFLDELGEMPLIMQAKLLRVIQERETTPIGGEKSYSVDVRIISATNKNLLSLIKKGEFREDLYYRLNVVEIKAPSLKKREGDIPLLTRHFLKTFNKKNKKSIKGITPEAMDMLIKYNWPGNVRELMNAIERGVVLSSGDYMDKSSFSWLNSGAGDERQTSNIQNNDKKNISLKEAEKRIIIKTLEACGDNKTKAAKLLRITRKTLNSKLNYKN
ncbi:MAG: sigma-54-dependent Fis family transcriptional regulator [Deltaproteobacteria bacterium]|nr:sigma-54-dependent Fis family transcriptional regulator [Deltaproteobacteria bacterium]